MHEPAQLERDVAPVLEQVAPLGPQRACRVGARRQQRLDDLGHGRVVVHRHRVGQGRSERGTLAGRQAPPEAGTGQRGQELRPPPRRGVGPLAGRAAHAHGRRPCLGAAVERVEPDGPARPQRHRAHAPRVGQVAVLPLRVDDPGPPSEHGLTPQEGLDERALAPPDLAEHHHVRVGHDAGRVELEGVEDERAPEQVVADDHAPLAQARLGDERVRRTEVARRHLVRRQLRHALPHAGERSGDPPARWPPPLP